MILDNVRNRNTYYNLGDRLKVALEYLGTISKSAVPEGRVEIAGTDVYATFDQYQTEGTEGRLYESHRIYLDVQYVIEGRETIRVRGVEGLTTATPYDGNKDIAFYTLTDGTDVRLFSGDFLVLFPQDAHVPKLICSGTASVRKVVVKVRL